MKKTEQRAIGVFGGCALSFGLMAGIYQNGWLFIPTVIGGMFYFIFRNK
jgi:uncharacterized membrane protein YccC